ncbi:MAG: GNAT family N-acetyltransferase [Clostridium sp.]|nr:GNAT family N-acetyltransferase [Clostridium sp.]
MSFQLTTDHLLLQVEDASKAEEVLAFYQKNQSVFDPFEPTRPENFYTVSYQRAAMQYEYTEIVKGKSLRYYIYLLEAPDTVIGSVNFSRILHGPFSSTSIGYKIDISHQQRGYATEACMAAIPIIFSNYQIHRIEARVAPNNTASIKLLEHLDFRFEGIEYQSVEVDGHYQDHYRYSLLSPL